MNRRGFFATIAGAIAAKFAPKVLPPEPEALGMAVRFIQTYGPHGEFSRLDILYGMSFPRPEFVVMVTNIEEPKAKMSLRFDPARLPA